MVLCVLPGSGRSRVGSRSNTRSSVGGSDRSVKGAWRPRPSGKASSGRSTMRLGSDLSSSSFSSSFFISFYVNRFDKIGLAFSTFNQGQDPCGSSQCTRGPKYNLESYLRSFWQALKQ